MIDVPTQWQGDCCAPDASKVGGIESPEPAELRKEEATPRKGGLIAAGERRDDWMTPEYIWRPLDNEFCFKIDLAASPTNRLCDIYFTKEKDALKMNWSEMRCPCFFNPPFDIKNITSFVKNTRLAARTGAGPFVGLLPVKSDQAWWHEHVINVAQVRFIRGRVKFLHAEGKKAWGCGYPCAVIVWSPLQMHHQSPEYFDGFATYGPDRAPG